MVLNIYRVEVHLSRRAKKGKMRAGAAADKKRLGNEVME